MRRRNGVPAGALLLSGKVYFSQTEYEAALAARAQRRARLMRLVMAERGEPLEDEV
jgi:hypothetical protein